MIYSVVGLQKNNEIIPLYFGTSELLAKKEYMRCIQSKEDRQLIEVFLLKQISE
jgi:hypothetical protein